MFNKKEFKNYVSELIKSSDSWFVKDHCARIESMCRAAINRSSYEFRCGEADDKISTYLEKDGRKIIIERPNTEIGSGYMGPLYARIYDKAQEFIESAKKTYVPSEITVQ